MNERAQTMSRMYTEDRMTYQEIAEAYGISRQRVHQLIGPVVSAHEGQARRAERAVRLTAAYERIMARETTLDQEAEALGYASGDSLRSILRRLGLRIVLLREKKHGTRSSYVHGCRCDLCREAAAEAARERYESGTPPKHGTASGYFNFGCKCQRCKEAVRVYARQRRAARRQRKEVRA